MYRASGCYKTVLREAVLSQVVPLKHGKTVVRALSERCETVFFASATAETPSQHNGLSSFFDAYRTLYILLST